MISLRIDWFDLLAVQGTLNSLLQNHSSKEAILQSAFSMVQLSHPYMTTRETIAMTIQTFVSKVMSLLFNVYFIITFISFLSCLSNDHNNAPLNLSTVRIHYIRYSWEYTKLAISDNYQPPNMVPWASLIAQLVKNSPAMQETPV